MEYMSRLPVIVAQGGVSPAGRTSGFHGYRRLIIDCLNLYDRRETLKSLAALGNKSADCSEQTLLDGTLVRRLENTLFDSNAIYHHHPLELQQNSHLVLSDQRLPRHLPEGWVIEKRKEGKVCIKVSGSHKIMLPSCQPSAVNAAGQLPNGFQPDKLYQSRHHPRSLTMTVFGASDAIASSGLNWSTLKEGLSPDDMAVYAGSSMSQMDYNGHGGLLQARLLGKRVTSKQCPLGFAEMSADFINAYILGSLGSTGTSIGACASMLYNLQQGVSDIRSGKRRVVLVGSSEAPITPEIIDGYTAMGALASDEMLRLLDNIPSHEDPDWRRSCRPFSNNCGFTLGESCQYFVLMDDDLAIECGAEILGAVGDVYINADGYKKSIAAPGAGNYITVSKAVALGRAIIGEKDLRTGCFVQAHGTGTPQNRVTESHILSEVARTFGIDQWPISAVKCYLGHPLGAAAGDQIMSALGVWRYGWLPGITTIDSLADDVHSDFLNILKNHYEVNAGDKKVALINAKGFGGNNATALLLSPQLTERMLSAKHGVKAMSKWRKTQEKTLSNQSGYEQNSLMGTSSPIYQFGQGVLSGEDLSLNNKHISVPGLGKAVNLDISNPFWTYS